jgi:hypothetical protein
MPKNERMSKNYVSHAPMGWVAFVAFVGAFVYFARNAGDFVAFVNAFVQALVWPGILLYNVLSLLHA